MRVVAGSLRGRPIQSPPGDATRPTTDRVREAVFNALFSLGRIEDAVVVDLFAGSGALGIEALSRGARSCTFVERDRAASSSIRANVEALGLRDRSRVVQGDAIACLADSRAVDLLLADPPYGYDRWAELLDAASAVLADGAIVVIESDRALDVGAEWEEVRAKRYGRTWVTFLRRA